MDPVFSIVMNCHNGESFLEQAVESIKLQTFQNFEVVFFDNASTDRSAEIVSKLGDKLSYISSSTLIPLGQARAEAVTHCKGQWIAFLDSDDLWLPEKLESQIKFLSNLDKPLLIYGGVQEIDETGHVIRTVLRGASGEVTLGDLLHDFDINMVTPLLNRDKLIELKLNFDPSVEASEEYNLFMRIAAVGKVYYSNEVLGKYRVYDSSLTNKKIHRWSKERVYTLAAILHNNPKIFVYEYKAVTKALDKGIFYHACFLAANNEFGACRKYLSKIIFNSPIYFCLYLIAFFPIAWNLVNSRKYKAVLTTLLNRVTKLIGLKK